LIFLAILVELDAVDSALVEPPVSAQILAMTTTPVPLINVFLAKEETDAVTPKSLALTTMPAQMIPAILSLDANTPPETAMEQIPALCTVAFLLLDVKQSPELAVMEILALKIFATPIPDVNTHLFLLQVVDLVSMPPLETPSSALKSIVKSPLAIPLMEDAREHPSVAMITTFALLILATELLVDAHMHN
jgi:hypothetical protein